MHRLIICLLLISVIGCSETKEKSIKIVCCRQACFHEKQERVFSGIINPFSVANLSFRVKGTIANFSVMVGAHLQKGEEVATLEQRDYKNELSQKEADLLETEAIFKKTRAAFHRCLDLYEVETISLEELEEAKMEYESSKARVIASKNRLDLAVLHLSDTILCSPIDGVVASKKVEVGENIKIGQVITTIYSDGPMKVEVFVPEKLVSKIHLGQRVDVEFSALPGKVHFAHVIEVGTNTSGTAYPVVCEMLDKISNVFPGMSAEVKWVHQEEKFFPEIPLSALLQEGGETFIYLLVPLEEKPWYGVVFKKKISIGELTGDGVTILEGLKCGEIVVTRGLKAIEEGEVVKMRLET
ncbi:MAG: efflux RND transporter periplasmic adaptor subunit [Chlamydiia bacterium]|nr:efflux RND transporter periplasmic adaptor subunit [Chlamydiia bacterium]